MMNVWPATDHLMTDQPTTLDLTKMHMWMARVGYDDGMPYADDVSDDITTNNDGPPDNKPTDNDGYNNA